MGTACASTDLDLVIAGVERLIVVAPLVIFGLILLAVVGVERPVDHQSNDEKPAADRPAELSFGQAWSVLRASPQVAYFFGVLSLFTFSLFLQEAVLEPYGGAIFGMDVCATTRLNAIWGVGTLVGIASTGFCLLYTSPSPRDGLLSRMPSSA